MGSIYPSNSQKSLSPLGGSQKKVSFSKEASQTVEKVKEAAQLHETGRQKEAYLLKSSLDLAKFIHAGWNEDDPEILAEKIASLSERVSSLDPSSTSVKKIQEQAKKLEFQFVFPIALELSKNPPPGTEFQFARTIHQMAKEVLKSNSLDPIRDLSDLQKKEIVRYARRDV